MNALDRGTRHRSVHPAVRAVLPLALLLLSAFAGTAFAQTSGGKFVIARGDPPSILDPHKTGEAAADQIHVLLGGGLMALEPELGLVPHLAESVEQSADGLTYTFVVRQDVRFHNGDPLTADDFKYTYERALDPATQSAAAGDMLANIASIEVPDEYTLVIHLSAPSAVFLRNMSYSGYLQPLSRRAIEEQGDNYGRNPVGVGPYRFKEWIAGYAITLERNPDYDWAPAYFENQGAPYPDEIEVRYIPEQGTLIAALETGEVDLAIVNATDLFIFEDDQRFEIYSSLRNGIGRLFIFNLNDPILADLRVRQAFSHAVDKQFFIDRSLEGLGIPATSALPPSLPGYDPASADSDYDFDREAAAALLDEAGWLLGADGLRYKEGQPLRIRIVAYSQTEVVRDSELLQNQLRAVGVDVSVETYERTLQTPMLQAGDYQIAPLGWTYGDPDVLYLLYHSTQNPNGLNYGAVNDPELDRLLEAGRTTIIDEDRMLVYHDVQRVLNEGAYLLPVYVQESFSVASSRVEGLRFNALGSWLLHDLWLNR